MGDVLALTGVAHTVALDGLREDHRRLVLVTHGRGVSGIDLVRIVPATVEAPDVVIAQVGVARKYGSPQTRWTVVRNLEQIAPLIRVGIIISKTTPTLRFKIKRC